MNVLRQLFDHATLPEGCWVWQGGTSEFGHGRMRVNGTLVSPHRIAYQLFVGPLSDDEKVLHKCDNPPCFNPFHLFKGTYSDNMKDCAAKGRLNVQKDPSFTQGERRPTAKLTDNAVREIRRSAGTVGIRQMAEKFGVHKSIIQKVIKRTRWAHVKDNVEPALTDI